MTKVIKIILDPTFKTRIGNHKMSFTHRIYGKETTLSRKIWVLKDEGYEYEISWKMMERAQPFCPVTGAQPKNGSSCSNRSLQQ